MVDPPASDIQYAIVQHSAWSALPIATLDTRHLEQPTVQDLVEEAAHIHRRNCVCIYEPALCAWSVLLPETSAMITGPPPGSHKLALDTPLASLGPAVRGHVQILVDVDSSDEDGFDEHHKRFCQKRLQIWEHGNGRALQHAGPELALPSRPWTSNEMYSTNGMRFVDKTPFLPNLLSLFANGPRFPIIRRPKGFGKTTFLSTVEAFFDVLGVYEYYPFIYEQLGLSRRILCARGQVLIFHLDLADLAFESRMSFKEVADECRRIMSRAVQAFYSRYRLVLTSDVDFSQDVQYSFRSVLHWVRRSKRMLFIGVDNYTAPALYAVRGLEHTVANTLFWEIIPALYEPEVYGGFMVGEELPDYVPWEGSPVFEKQVVRDLTLHPRFQRTIGFTEDEIRALGKTLSVDLMAQIKPKAITLKGKSAASLDGKDLVYSASDVLAFARSLLQLEQSPSPATKVQVFVCPPQRDGQDTIYDPALWSTD